MWRSSSAALKYMYGASSNDASLLNINITATDPAQITNEDIGLRLRINGVNVNVRRCCTAG